MNKLSRKRILATVIAAFVALALVACSPPETKLADSAQFEGSMYEQPYQPAEASMPEQADNNEAVEEEAWEEPSSTEEEQWTEWFPAELNIIEDYRSGFIHGDKGWDNQKYIVLHDTEGTSDPASVISWWDGNGNLVASHFIVGMDGTVYQCVPMDKIAHHAGYGDTGHNSYYGIVEDGRDDMIGTAWVGDWASDYGMNAWSIGIEMVHVGGSGYYPEAQLDALDALIKYIDDYYGFESFIIDHKAWRSGNSDTSPEFAYYLYNYQVYRRHEA